MLILNRTNKILSLLVIVICSLAGQAIADEYHYNSLLIGDRASGMGGAYIAIADDPSGLYYNPAGTVYTASSNLSASMNAYNISKTTYKEVLGPGVDWERTSSLLIPNFFGITQPLGPGTLGFSYAVTDSAFEDQDQTFLLANNTEFTINFNNTDTTINAGPSYAVTIGKNFALGITMYGVMRTQEQILNQMFDFENSASASTTDIYHWENSYVAREEYGVKPLLGIMYTPFEKLSLGMTVSQVYMLRSSTNLQTSCSTTFEPAFGVGACNEGAMDTISQAYSGSREFPLVIGFGAAYFATNALILSADATYHSPINGTRIPVVNASAGLELYVTDTIAIRMGTYTNFSNTKELTVGVLNANPEHIDMYGGSFSFTSFTRSSSLTLGVTGSYGSGEAQVIQGSPNLNNVEAYTATAFMSAAYSY